MANKKQIKTVRIMGEDGEIKEVTEVGVPGLFQPQQCDIDEIMENNDAYREHLRDLTNDCS